MELLNKDQQETALMIFKDIASSPLDTVEDYTKLAKDFLQSLKPKIYICRINLNNVVMFMNVSNSWYSNSTNARVFYSQEEALESLFDVVREPGYKYFIYTEIMG